jgi:catechol 2,3-dioxygenase-like lactoylglutathione lyase family enzyme
MKIVQIDHFVLTVRDLTATCDFYTRVMGMEVVTFAGGRKALQFGEQKINLHQLGSEFDPKARVPTSGSADFCLLVDTSIEHVIEHLKTCGVTIEEGPVQRTGANGPITSVYIRDPDGNLIELARYGEL